jgi:tripartite-type tricarboxylate transporter receptor subunit TctC
MRKLLALLLAAPLLGALLPVFAQSYPAKPVRIIVPFAPGGGSDLAGRLVAAKLSERMGGQFIVDNRPGAGSNLGAELAVKAPADGYTLLLISASYTVNPSVYKLSFDPINDITPIIQISGGPYVVAIHPSVPANNLAEFVALVKKQPDKYSYGSSGTGSIMHVASEYFLDAAKIKVVHIPYKGTGPAVQDTLGGQVQLVFGAVPVTLPHVKAGRLRALAVTTDKRIAAAPDLPTVAESGYPGYEVTNWHGLVGPKGLPRDIVARLNKEIGEVVKGEDMKKNLAADGLEPAGGSPERFGEILRNEMARWAKVVQQAGIKVE